MTKKILLNNDVSIPVIGLGTYKIGMNDDETYRAVRTALDKGYRHIDTATLYMNEKPVGKAIRESGILREDIFVTTKLWGTDILNNRIQMAFEGSLKNLGLDYIDLYLVHWPVKGMVSSAWKAMEDIYIDGKTRAIGVSNHLIHHLEELLKDATVIPAVNQIELHPYLIQQEIIDYCKGKGIAPEAWSPLGSKKNSLLQDETLVDIAGKHGKSPAQVVLRWNIQKGIVTIPKSSHEERLAENIDIFDFRLSDDEIKQIDKLDRNRRTGVHPDFIEF
ncbi:Glyoxal reductase [Fermentimonas caenicola]|jgi:diketogulonate reductase-like aldo/keto reductase|uniref:Glyoxal reductase n=1 Tax=Fermentimonas caenicola TaxID=1562970 RepID=A0A098BYS8_9BACT|nr:Glyoxal reductase [Fermentimonas caenicola]